MNSSTDPTGADTPRARILERHRDLSSKQSQVARFLLDREEEVVFGSVRDVAAGAGVGPSTVVRFCRSLGYDGFAEYQQEVRRRLLSQDTFVQRLRKRLDRGSFEGSPIPELMSIHTRNIESTLGSIDENDLQRSVGAILSARTVRIFGSGLAAAVAVGLEHGLSVLGIQARATTDGGIVHLREIAAICPDDLVVVISVRRYVRDMLDAAEEGKARGAGLIAITDSEIAPVSEWADVVFVADTTGSMHSSSQIGLMSVVHLLSVSVAAARPDESLAALERLDALYRKSGVFLE